MKYTIVLKRPDYMGLGADDGEDLYVALVESADVDGALSEARAQVFEADRRDAADSDGEFIAARFPSDYSHLITFHGHVEPVWWGWQIQ